MKNNISIQRIVPNIYSNHIEKSKQFYTEFLGMELAMDMEWIVTFVSKENRTAQVSIFQNKEGKSIDNSQLCISIEVSDVNKMYERAKTQQVEISYTITNESWGVRRFFVKDPNGVTINILSHLK